MAYQISIFLENKVGSFEKVTRVLKEHHINIRTMTLNNTANGWGILNLLVDLPEKAYEALNSSGFSVALREIVALEMADQSGGLDELLVKIARAGINFDNAFGRIVEERKRAMLVLDIPDIEHARKLMAEHNINELPDNIVYGRE